MNRFLIEKHARQSEEGMTVVEVMVAIVIIAIVLVFTGIGLAASFKASVYSENRAKAASYASDVIAIAKQSSYRQLWIPNPVVTTGSGGNSNMFNISQSGVDKTERCTTTIVNATGATSAAKTGVGTEPFKGIVHCQTRQAENKGSGVGTTFYIQTKIGYVPTGDGFSQKRVQVDVKWKDISNNGKTNTYTETYSRTPTAGDCVPPSLLGGAAPALGCG